MRAVIQRVSEASCTVDGQVTGQIGLGLLVLLGVEESDTLSDVQWLCQKVVNLRVFSDEEGLMNLSVMNVQGSVLLISQFTLMAQTKKGNRPSFIRAAKPDQAIPIYEAAKKELERVMGRETACGVFGADMKIQLVNDGPVTIIMDTQDKDNH